MPHATNMPLPGFQALVLCGPGASLSTFTTKPEDFPKATIPIANRPMIWYALDYCYRMGINEIFVVTPPASLASLADTLATNPHLTSLPNPKPTLIAPKSLTHESGTATILRAPEVRKALTSDFVILPCDLVSELPGESLLEAWMIQQTDLDGASSRSTSISTSSPDANAPRKGGLGVWYPTKGEGAFKGAETDFLITSAFRRPAVKVATPVSLTSGSPTGSGFSSGDVRERIEAVRYAMPTDTLKDTLEDAGSLALRSALLARTGRVKMRTTYRDAHIYIFPRWVLEMVEQTPELDSLSEDVVGNWAKATWQDGFGEKLGLRNVFHGQGDGIDASSVLLAEEKRKAAEPDVMAMCSTRPTDLRAMLGEDVDGVVGEGRQEKLEVPPFLGYVHPLETPGTLLRRVDNMPTLLSVSLRLAKLESVEEAKGAASPLAHPAKIAHPAGIAQRCTVTKADCLLAENVQVEEKCVVKESVIGANCVIKSGARLTRCLLMDDVVVEERCQLTDCIIGRRARIGKESVLKECRVQDGNAVAEETDAKGEDIMVFEGMDEVGNFETDDDDGEAGEETVL